MSHLSDMDYLKDESIGKVLSMGLAEVYRKNPAYPIDYFAKWLLNYERQQEEKAKQVQKIVLKEQKLETIRQRKIEEEALRKEEQKVKEAKVLKEKEFENMVAEHQYHEELLQSQLAVQVEKECGLSGVYIGVLDHPDKTCDVEQDDQDDAHIDKTQPKVIKYIGSSESHAFLRGSTLQQDQGITFRVFGEKGNAEVNNENEEEGQENKVDTMAGLVENDRYVYVENVVENPQMFYHRIPQLGGYIALPLVYNSSLTEPSFDAALLERERFNKRKEEIAKEKEEKEVEYQEKLKEMEENGEDPADHEAAWQAQCLEWEEVKEEAVQTVKREFVVCCDMMGQDQGISEERREWLARLVKLFADSWAANEEANLKKDINLQADYLKGLEGGVADAVEVFRQEEEQAAEEKTNTLDQELNEKQQMYEVETAKWEKVVAHLQQDNVIEYLGHLSHFRVVKYTGLLQGVLLFLGYKKSEINLPNTNVLDWKNVRNLLAKKECFLDKVLAYDFKGAKAAPVEVYAKINRLQNRFAQFSQEEVDNYNLGLGRLLRWVTMTLSLRKLDIELRRELKIRMDQEREEKLKAEEERQQQKEQAFQEHKAGLVADDLEAFNEEEWRATFDEDYPVIEIPPVMPEDEDNDLEVDSA